MSDMQNKTEMDKGETSGEVDEIYASDVTEKESASGYSILLAFRNVAVCVSVCVLMFVKIDIPDFNIVAMIFFAVVGLPREQGHRDMTCFSSHPFRRRKHSRRKERPFPFSGSPVNSCIFCEM